METVRRRGAVIALLLVTLTLGGVAPPASASRAADDRRSMTQLTNHSRETHDVRRARIALTISELARRHSLAMARRGYLFHTDNPERVYLDGKTWHVWGENVGVTGGGLADLEQAFMASAPHRANILDQRFRRVAIGVVRADGLVWVTVFFWG
jgi:uncharacterized protein YkwD